jgi:membrane protein
MAKVSRARVYRERLTHLLSRGPQRPSDLSWRSWFGVFRRTIVEFINDDLTDKAAALTYYGILSIFPGLLVLLAGVGLLGSSTTDDVVANIKELAPGPAREIIETGIVNLQDNPRTAGVLAIVGLVVAFWSATSYVAAFMRAANAIFDVPEARPMWKTLPIQLLVTAITGVFLAASALAIVFTGRFAQFAGRALGFEQASIRAFDIIKWPVLVVIAGLLMALLYWVGPNARHAGFRWITPGSVLAVLVWITVSAGFALYISRYDSYDRIYGALGGVIIFLIWLWLTNVAVLIGAEFDAELGRARAIAAGLPRDAEPYLPLRDVPSRDRREHELPEPADAEKDPPKIEKPAVPEGNPLG